MVKRNIYIAIILLGISVGLSVIVTAVFAHCDTMNGPVIPEAKAALAKGDITPILKWIKPENETEVKAAFVQAARVRAQSPEARELADKYFLETLIRLHRAGEGAPYSGLKDTPPEKIVILADEALTRGSPDEMIRIIQAHIDQAIREKFNAALKAAKNKDKSVEMGREYVRDYVTYMHYVEGIHAAILSAGDHHDEAKAVDTHLPEQGQHVH